ncbi:MAG TPA: hemolysin family protein, partial [Candidatus Lustribacter sp.]|nr:hemolysin family protein [Candidatus Lustribacter sp.]
MNGALLFAAVLATIVAFCFATSEAAILRMSRVRAAELLEDGRSGAESLVQVVSDTAPYLAVITFVRVIAEATTAVVITLAVYARLQDLRTSLLVSVAVMAVVSFVVVGVSPRTLGAQNYVRVALVSAPLAVGLRSVLGPVAQLLVLVGNMVTPGKGFRDGPFRSESELRDLVDMAGESSVIEHGEREMIQSVFDLGDTIAREVMVPRTDMVTIAHDKNLRQANSLFLRSGFSRIPVAGEDSDDILGLLYLKDVLLQTSSDPAAASKLVESVMRPMSFVPDSKPVDDLLREMQREQSHFAIVVDEYGGTAGLVTIEDILEEIVGEIADEHDREAPGVEVMANGTTRVPAQMHIDDLADLFDVRIDEEEVDTVGGLLAKLVGRVPIPGSSARIAGLTLRAERMAGRRHRLATVIVSVGAAAAGKGIPAAADVARVSRTAESASASADSPST